jgi:hypothetical protein
MKTKKPTKKVAPAANERPTINAELVDQLFKETIANMMALQFVWERISLKEELSNDA